VNRILIIEPDPGLRAWLSGALNVGGVEVTAVEDAPAGVGILKREEIHLFFVSLGLPGEGAMGVIREAQRMADPPPAIVVARPDQVDEAVALVWQGAYDFTTTDAATDHLLLAVHRALRLVDLMDRNRALQRIMKKRYDFPLLTGNSPKIQKLFQLLDKVAETDASVLLVGEQGTGKFTVARTIHAHSMRSRKPFVTAHCGAVPETMLVEGLFGRESGAYTQNVRVRPGRLEQANGGTIFLEDVDLLHSTLQARLLQVFTMHEFERVGGTSPILLDVRVVSSSRVELDALVRAGRFDPGLYEFLCKAVLHVPPLRERAEDIPIMAAHFAAEVAERLKKPAPALSSELVRTLVKYRWPGNVQELEDLLERLVTLATAPGEITLEHLPPELRPGGMPGPGTGEVRADVSKVDLPAGGASLPGLVDELERSMIVQALDRTGGVKSSAARLLGLNRTTLIEKMRKKGMALKDRPGGE
jgi:DNA-binding NtrC family response regulator